MSRDASPEYWETYTNLQRVKHQLIHDYLNGWFPKLGLSNSRIIYFDTHAGRGEYRTGESGSPIVALETFLNHNFRDRILGDCEVRFYKSLPENPMLSSMGMNGTISKDCYAGLRDKCIIRPYGYKEHILDGRSYETQAEIPHSLDPQVQEKSSDRETRNTAERIALSGG